MDMLEKLKSARFVKRWLLFGTWTFRLSVARAKHQKRNDNDGIAPESCVLPQSIAFSRS